MEIVTSWERKGMHEGKEGIITRIIRKRFGSVSTEIEKRLNALSTDELDTLGEDLLDFTSPTDLETWLSRHQQN